MVEDINYANFKDTVSSRQGAQRAHANGEIGSVLRKLTPKEQPATAPGNKAAYGGVIFDDKGRVLLREPTGHYDRYVWTFSKGRPEPGESPEDTAIRETREETGL